MRPRIALVLLSGLALALGACGGKQEAEAPPPRAAAPPPPPPPPPPPAEAPKVEASTPIAPKPPAPEDFYTAGRLRDPFVTPGSAGGGPAVQTAVEVSTESFSIHNLALKGILETPKGPIALLVDPTTSASYVLKSGKVLGAKDKPVPGISGQVRGRTVRLMTADKDVQELRLGEEEEQ